MTKPNDPAFPVEGIDNERGTIVFKPCGLTKREWFAGMAMQGFLAVGPRELLACYGREVVGEYVARQSVNMADLLIADLAKETK